MSTFHLESDFSFPNQNASREELLTALQDMYNQMATSINDKPDLTIKNGTAATSAPSSTDYRFPIGTVWLNKQENAIYQMTNKTDATTVSWCQLTCTVVSGTAPTAADNNYVLGTLWLDTSVPRLYVISAGVGGTATWTALN